MSICIWSISSREKTVHEDSFFFGKHAETGELLLLLLCNNPYIIVFWGKTRRTGEFSQIKMLYMNLKKQNNIYYIYYNYNHSIRLSVSQSVSQSVSHIT